MVVEVAEPGISNSVLLAVMGGVALGVLLGVSLGVLPYDSSVGAIESSRGGETDDMSK